MGIKKELPGVKENVLLKDYTTFKIGGKAKYFFLAKNKTDIIKAISVAKKLKLPFFILGGGSNILVSDQGYKGLVIKILNTKYKILNTKIYTEAGVLLSLLVSEPIKNGLAGLEWAIGIPGTVGGAIYGNAGAFGKSMGDIVEKVEVYDSKDNKIKIFKKNNCRFGYRESIFKQKRNLIILSATFQLKKGNKTKIKTRITEYLNYRKDTQPLNFPSIGSIFKNPAGLSAGELGEEDKSSSSAFAAARLIEECGLKGKMIGKAKISEKHANFILNLGGATAEDVKKLIGLIQRKVKEKFKINLEEEIQYLGFKK